MQDLRFTYVSIEKVHRTVAVMIAKCVNGHKRMRVVLFHALDRFVEKIGSELEVLQSKVEDKSQAIIGRLSKKATNDLPSTACFGNGEFFAELFRHAPELFCKLEGLRQVYCVLWLLEKTGIIVCAGQQLE